MSFPLGQTGFDSPPSLVKSISADQYSEYAPGNLDNYDSAQHLRSDQIRPEDLQAYAQRQSNSTSGPGDHYPPPIKVVTAQQFAEDSKKHLGRKSTGLSRSMTPVVFAMPTSCADTGRKVVDFYYTWKGKKGTKPLKGPRRKSQFLSGEFENKVLTALHEDPGEIQRMNSLGRPSHDNFTPRPQVFPLPTDSKHDEVLQRPPVRPTSAGTASTMSIPFAAMAQFSQDGVSVAASEQMHLRAVNPDSLSPTTTESSKPRRKTKRHHSSPLATTDAPPPTRTASVSSSETLIEKESTGVHSNHHHSSDKHEDVGPKSSSHRHRSRRKDRDASSPRRHKSSSRHRSKRSPRRSHSDTETRKARDEPVTVVLMDEEENYDPRPWHNIDRGRLTRDSTPTPPELTRSSPWASSSPLPVLTHYHSEPQYYRSNHFDEWESESDSDSDDNPGYTPFPPQLARQIQRYSLEDFAPVMPFSRDLQRTLEQNTPQSHHTPLPHTSPVMLPQHSSGYQTPQSYSHSPHPSVQHYSPFPSLQFLPLPNLPLTAHQSPYMGPNTLYSGQNYSQSGYPSHIYANYVPI